MDKTLGGERLGSGKKMKVEIRNFERSTHDLSYVMRTTMSAGTLVPFMTEVALPGDTFDIDLSCEIMTHPTEGPLLGSFKVQLDTFLIPIRLYNSLLHNNALNIGMDMSQVKFPVFEMNLQTTPTDTFDWDNCQVNPSSLMAYLGIEGYGQVGTNNTKRTFNAIPLIGYWDIYKNYYCNKPEGIGAYIHREPISINQTVSTVVIGVNTLPKSPSMSALNLSAGTIITVNWVGAAPDLRQIMINTRNMGSRTLHELCGGDATVGTNKTDAKYQFGWFGQQEAISWNYITGTPRNAQPEIVTFPLTNLDEMREQIITFRSRVAPFKIDKTTYAPYGPPLKDTTQDYATLGSQEGLGLKTYQSDLFNNWLDTETIEGAGGINEITAVSTAGDSFTIDTLNLSRKVYMMLNRIAASGGSYNDWQDAIWNQDRYKQAETPMYMGGLIKELVFQEVTNTSGTLDQPLASIAGKGRLSQKHKGGKVYIKVDEPSFIMAIISLTPRVDYSQGNKWHMHLKTMDDLHKPDLDQIGFQDLISEQLAWWTTKNNAGNWIQTSVGKQPAWLNYMTNVNVTRGNFAIKNNEMFMTLNRRYERAADGTIKDMTTYIDPAKFNYIFADTSLDAQNFWVQIGVGMIARRKMSAKVMPNL